MADDLIFYTNPMSRGRTVRWMLEETGQPYRTELLNYGDDFRKPDFLAVNPMGKVPALRHGDVVVTEGAAICAYLADAFPDAGLAPPHASPFRAPYYRWLFFTAGPLDAMVMNKAMGVETPPDKQRMASYGDGNRLLDTLEAAVSTSEYLAGPRFTAADLYLGSALNFVMQFGMVEKRAAFVSFVERVTARPAAKRASEIDDALIAQNAAASA